MQQYWQIMKRFDRLHVIHRILLSRAAQRHGLYQGQPPVLRYILEHPSCTQREIADFLQVSTPSITNSVKRMQKAGLLKKETDSQDLRCSRLIISPLGEECLNAFQAEAYEIDAHCFSGISQSEREALCSLLDRMAENLTTEEFSGKTLFSLVGTYQELEEKKS